VRFNQRPIIRTRGQAAVLVQNATNFTVSGLTIDGAAYGVPSGRGIGGGPIFVRNSNGGVIRDNSLSYTQADSIHITGGSKNIEVIGNRIDHAGDDSIAVVNYKDGTCCVRIRDNVITDNLWGRGITMVGGSNVQITGNFIDGNLANLAGIYVASEGAYRTAAPSNVLVQGNTVQNTGGPGPGHGQIMIYAGNGPINNVTVRDNEIRDSKGSGFAMVLSGPLNGITLEGNRIDGEISRRNGASYGGSGNTVNDVRMADSAPMPKGTPAPGPGDGFPSGQDGDYTPPVVPPTPTPDLTPRGSASSDWTPQTVLPAIDAMRRTVTSTTYPPNC
jgi:hypothetical protein